SSYHRRGRGDPPSVGSDRSFALPPSVAGPVPNPTGTHWFRERLSWTRIRRAATVATMHSGPSGLPAVVVVGAGAAGIGAGLALARSGVPYIILEASSRPGGRAYTDFNSLGALFDHGFYWFHSADRNPLRVLADRLGHAYAALATRGVRPLCVDGKWLDEPE